MGLSWSNPRRRRRYPYPPPPPPHHSYYYYSADPHHHPPPPPPLPPPPSGYFPAPPYPPPPPPPHHHHDHHPPYPAYPPPPPLPSYCGPVSYGACPYSGPVVGRAGQHPYYANQASGWPAARPAAASAAVAPTVAHVEHHQIAKKVRNVVNVHKDTIRVEIDEHDPGCHLVSFLFDALHDGRC